MVFRKLFTYGTFVLRFHLFRWVCPFLLKMLLIVFTFYFVTVLSSKTMLNKIGSSFFLLMCHLYMKCSVIF